MPNSIVVFSMRFFIDDYLLICHTLLSSSLKIFACVCVMCLLTRVRTQLETTNRKRWMGSTR